MARNVVEDGRRVKVRRWRKAAPPRQAAPDSQAPAFYLWKCGGFGRSALPGAARRG